MKASLLTNWANSHDFPATPALHRPFVALRHPLNTQVWLFHLFITCHGLQELNSVEAIKGAVEHGLGVAFVSVTAIQKELDLGLASCVSINGVRLTRTLRLVSNPRRDYSRIARKFMVDVFGMANLDAKISQQHNEKIPSKPLPHISPAARPWESGHTAHTGGLGRPILQQVQNLRWRAQ